MSEQYENRLRELEERNRLLEERVKQLTGGESESEWFENIKAADKNKLPSAVDQIPAAGPAAMYIHPSYLPRGKK